MIFTTITLNPCLDRREYLESFSFGGTNRPYKSTVSAGGKGINVSKELLKLIDPLKASIRTLTFAGGKTGEVFKELLAKELGVKEGVSGLGGISRGLGYIPYRARRYGGGYPCGS